jgi:hypothetical protein
MDNAPYFLVFVIMKIQKAFMFPLPLSEVRLYSELLIEIYACAYSNTHFGFPFGVFINTHVIMLHAYYVIYFLQEP